MYIYAYFYRKRAARAAIFYNKTTNLYVYTCMYESIKQFIQILSKIKTIYLKN